MIALDHLEVHKYLTDRRCTHDGWFDRIAVAVWARDDYTKALAHQDSSLWPIGAPSPSAPAPATRRR